MVCRMGGSTQAALRKGAATAALFPQSSSSGSFDANANPSVRFGNAVAATPEEFGERFGHYGRRVVQFAAAQMLSSVQSCADLQPGSFLKLYCSPAGGLHHARTRSNAEHTCTGHHVCAHYFVGEM